MLHLIYAAIIRHKTLIDSEEKKFKANNVLAKLEKVMPDQEALLNSIKEDVEDKDPKYPIHVSEIIYILKKAVDILKPESSTGQNGNEPLIISNRVEITQNSASKLSKNSRVFSDNEINDDESISETILPSPFWSNPTPPPMAITSQQEVNKEFFF